VILLGLLQKMDHALLIVIRLLQLLYLVEELLPLLPQSPILAEDLVEFEALFLGGLVMRTAVIVND